MKILSKLSVIACLCWATLASCESPDYETGRTAQVNGLMSVTIQIPGNPSKFAAIHISCIVNLTEIASIKCDQLKLKNNEVLYVAKKYRQEIKSRHLQNLKMKKL